MMMLMLARSMMVPRRGDGRRWRRVCLRRGRSATLKGGWMVEERVSVVGVGVEVEDSQKRLP
jgi:hypothetical protein